MKNKNHKKLARQVAHLREGALRALNQRPSEALTIKQISQHVGLRGPEEGAILIAVIEALVKEGKVIDKGQERYSTAMKESVCEGRISITRSGMAFVTVEGRNEDVRVSETQTGLAFNDDTVRIALVTDKKGKRQSGRVVAVVKRAREHYVCVLRQGRQSIIAVPDDARMNVDFIVADKQVNGARVGEKVLVSLLEWTDPRQAPLGEVVHVLGKPGEVRTEGDAILAEYGFPLAFPPEVEKAAAAIDKTITAEEITRRRDFRETLTFTIDPFDAKDFDDAISYRALDNGMTEVGVHIADVGHYVKPGTALEVEAQRRATSVYLVDRVVPMLPEVLSNDLCSLRPLEDKLCYSAVFEMDAEGNQKGVWIGKTIIHSRRRFTYEEVQAMIEGGEGDFQTELLALNKMAVAIRKRRMKAGAIAFEKTETRFELDDKKQPIRVFEKVQKEAHKLIEEFMLLANKAVAEHVGKRQSKTDQIKTFVYRIHDLPNELKLKELAEFVKRFGYKIDLTMPNRLASSINDMLAEVKGKPEQNLIEMLSIRTMAKAEYSTNNIGHFGLAFQHYSHFTSPIRRYPDVMAHRLLHHYTSGGGSAPAAELEKQCKHSSAMERQAAEAERESTKLYQVIYMKQFEGAEFDGVVSGVTEWGLFVYINETACEGLIRLRDLKGDFFVYDQKNLAVVGQRSKKKFALGAPIRVKVLESDFENRRVELTLARG